MYYTVYRITNILDGKFYIGKHQTNDLDDGYFGSGKLIKRAIQKHGIQNFKKEILHVLETEQEMNEKEKELVIIGESSYNICEGGQGGFSVCNSKEGIERRSSSIIHWRLTGAKAFEDKFKNDPKFKKQRIKLCKKISRLNRYHLGFKGKHHSDTSKQLIGIANSKRQSGKGNSNFGNRWITNPLTGENKLIPKNNEIPSPWIKGRKV